MEELRRQLAELENERDAAQAAQLAAEQDAQQANRNAVQAAQDLLTQQVAAQAAAAQAAQNLTALQAAAAANLAANPAPVVFALSPALAATGLIDYQSTQGMKLFSRAIAPLDPVFAGQSESLRLFLTKVNHRAGMCGWKPILKFTEGGASYDLISSYGRIRLSTIKQRGLVHAAANDRGSQFSDQMYSFLITSITDGLLSRVISKRDDFVMPNGFQDGPSLLKVIITISHVDTRAQAGHIRQCLARLSITVLTPEYNCDIQKLNEYVVVLIEGLAARGEESQDTMMNVHEAYIVCKDTEFVRHAKDEYAKWEQGATMELSDYMDSCLTKFKTLKMKGIWEAPSPEQEQIIALTAAVSSLKAKAARPSKSARSSSNKATNSGKQSGRNEGKFAWKDVAPKSGEALTKTVNGKVYHWCTHHPNPMWAIHNPNSFPDLCRNHPKYAQLEVAYKASQQEATTSGSNEMSTKDIELSDALAAIGDSDDESQE